MLIVNYKYLCIYPDIMYPEYSFLFKINDLRSSEGYLKRWENILLQHR